MVSRPLNLWYLSQASWSNALDQATNITPWFLLGMQSSFSPPPASALVKLEILRYFGKVPNLPRGDHDQGKYNEVIVCPFRDWANVGSPAEAGDFAACH